MTDAQRLRVTLGETFVGTLDLTRTGFCEFRMAESYRSAYPRPVLGQAFLDDPEKVHRTRVSLPAWFSNLLPEGPLRELLARQAGVSPVHEFQLLRHLGDDLPGAVRVAAEPSWRDADAEDEASQEAQDDAAHDTSWHFSLAGVQMKFSALQSGKGLTIPASGMGGDWIVKLPDTRYAEVPRNEHATLRWAEASGIRVPELRLINLADVSGLPAGLEALPERQALAVRRFDRPAPGERMHMEDFAQILGLLPGRKYDRYNHETQAKVILSLIGEAGLDEFVRRLVFVVASGNGDAHHKNWSLTYPDGVHAELSPAYDLVSTIQYTPGDRLALNLAGSKQWVDVTAGSFMTMARRIGADVPWMRERVAAAVEAVLSAWRQSASDVGYTAAERDRIDRHLKEVPLFGVRA